MPAPEDLPNAQVGEAQGEPVPPDQEVGGPQPQQSPDAEHGPAIPRSGSEFEGASERTANDAALPEIDGPKQMPVGSIGTFVMRLDYSIAGRDQLSQVVEAMNSVGYHWERFDITAMAKAGVPCVPGSEGALPDDSKEVIRIARSIGYPVIVKAAGGGGGRGMRVVHTEAALCPR